MKKLLSYFMIFLLILIPSYVKAEECDPKSINIQSITLTKKSDTVEELSEVSVNNNKVNLNLEMYNVGDFAEYKIKVKNTSKENYYFDENSIENASDYIQYEVHTKDNSNVIKPGKEKEFQLKIIYENEIEKTEFRSGKYVEDKNTIMNLSTKDNMIDIITNPKTSQRKIFIIILEILLVGILCFKKKKKVFLFLLSLFLIPLTAYAICKYNLEIDSNITINKVLPKYCTFDGDLAQGTEYVNGQYTYRYMQEGGYENDWNNIDSEGWGVILTDKDSTEDVTTPLCSYINDKPIISMSHMFLKTKSNNIDLSSFDTKNVINMYSMFLNTENIHELDFSSFNTENVTNMSKMFGKKSYSDIDSSIEKLDLRYFDTSKVTDMSYMFESLSNAESINLTGFDFTNISNTSLSGRLGLNQLTLLKKLNLSKTKYKGDMTYAFSYYTSESLEEIDFSDVDTSEVTIMNDLFFGSKFLKKIDLSSFDTQNVTSMNYMFALCSNLESVEFGNIDTSNVKDLTFMFTHCDNLKKVDLSKFDTSSLQDFSYLFSYCVNLEEANLSNLVKPNVIRYNNVFNEVRNIKKLIIDNWEPIDSNAGNSVFSSMSSPTVDLYISMKNWKLPSSFSMMYWRAYRVNRIDVSNWDLSNTTSLYQLFKEWYDLIEINGINTWKNTSNVTNISQMFSYCNRLNEIDLTGFDYSSVTNISYMFSDANIIKKINMGDFNALSLEDASYMIGLNNPYPPLEEITFNSISTPKLKNTSYMFSKLANLKKLDLRGMDTSNVTNMDGMFSQNYNLKELDLSTFETNDSQSLDGMFSECNSLTTAYARTQEDADRFNSTSSKPDTVNFIVKP